MSAALLSGPFPLHALIEHLAAVPALRLVGDAGDLEDARTTPPRALPAVYLLSEEYGRKPGDYTGHHAQPMEVVVQAVLWIRQARSAQAVRDLIALERLVRSQVIAWTPPAPFEPLWVSASGRAERLAAHSIRQVLFRTHYRDQPL